MNNGEDKLCEIISEEEKINRGNKIAQVLNLKKDKEYKDRYQTTWGTKTALGLYLTVKRIIEEGE